MLAACSCLLAEVNTDDARIFDFHKLVPPGTGTPPRTFSATPPYPDGLKKHRRMECLPSGHAKSDASGVDLHSFGQPWPGGRAEVQAGRRDILNASTTMFIDSLIGEYDRTTVFVDAHQL